jgi:SAM-dependent MidA family methyltransferase
MSADLPLPGAEAAAASHALTQLIATEIRRAGGWISFARYMELALYAPKLGYYTGGAHKFGDFAQGGDFVTAPELTPLFGQTLARQVVQVLKQVPSAKHPVVMEIGGGTGRLAADILLALKNHDALPQQYLILELSGELRARQAETLAQFAPDLLSRVVWLDSVPETFSGCLIANEVLDAMPTNVLRWDESGICERGVTVANDRLCWSDEIHLVVSNDCSGHGTLAELAQRLPPMLESFVSEINLAARAWVTTLAKSLDAGAMLLIDYGLPQHELYHPSRQGGTVRCHYRHRVHNDPFWYPGLSDITSHVDFTAVAEAGFDAGLEVLGYTNQANFLINCGIGELLQGRRSDAPVGAGETNSSTSSQRQGGRAKDAHFAVACGDTPSNQWLKAQGATNLLLSPNEMGELFKVIALGRGIAEPLLGFTRGDRVHAL